MHDVQKRIRCTDSNKQMVKCDSKSNSIVHILVHQYEELENYVSCRSWRGLRAGFAHSFEHRSIDPIRIHVFIAKWLYRKHQLHLR